MRGLITYLFACPEPKDYSRQFRRLIKLMEEGNEIMANNFDRLNAAVQSVADNVLDVAEAIRNPAVDNNDQEVIDELAGRLEDAASALDAATAEENAEDAGPAEPVAEGEAPNE